MCGGGVGRGYRKGLRSIAALCTEEQKRQRDREAHKAEKEKRQQRCVKGRVVAE